MTTLIPALGACSFATTGERRLAARLEQKLDQDYLLWYDVPISCGRDGEAPLIIRLPNLRAEATKIADLLNAAHQEGHAWDDMAVLCRHYNEMDECAQALSRWQLPFEVRERTSSFHPHEDTIKVMTMHASKGLEFPVVARMGVGQMPAAGEGEKDEARLFYVAATRTTQRLVITTSGDGGFGGG